MADTPNATPGVNRVLVKLRASAPLAAAERRATLRPVFDRPFTSGGRAADVAPQWFLADMPDLPAAPADEANPWDFAYARVADQLDVAEDDVIFAEPASKSAKHVLNMIIRALDYLPPVDVTFFEFLRALITADFDLVPDDRLDYRVAFIDAFRRRGIYPKDGLSETTAAARTLSVETLRWRPPDRARRPKHWDAIERNYAELAAGLKPYADECLYLNDRGERFTRKTDRQQILKQQFLDAFKNAPEFAREVGLNPNHLFNVEELRNAMRIGPDGQSIPQVLISLTQTVTVPTDVQTFDFPGGSSLIIDLTVPAVRYWVSKSVDNASTRKRTVEFLAEARKDPLHALFFRPDPRRPFAALHQLSRAL